MTPQKSKAQRPEAAWRGAPLGYAIRGLINLHQTLSIISANARLDNDSRNPMLFDNSTYCQVINSLGNLLDTRQTSWTTNDPFIVVTMI